MLADLKKSTRTQSACRGGALRVPSREGRTTQGQRRAFLSAVDPQKASTSTACSRRWDRPTENSTRSDLGPGTGGATILCNVMSVPHLRGDDVDDTDTREPQASSASQPMPSMATLAQEAEPDHNNKRRKRDRTASETDLLEAAFRLVERNGVLAGLNLQEVANEAGVNRGLIYRYFGSREGLLRAAISTFTWDKEEVFFETRGMPFPERRARVFELALKNGPFIKLEALLAITNVEEYRLFPRLERSWEDLEQDKREGSLPADADALVMHLLTAATYLGYAIFREAMAREADLTVAPGLTPGELDERAIRVFRSMMRAIANSPDEDK